MTGNATIIIPTHFRHAYLARVLEQYGDSGIPILVADSTNIPFENAAKYRNVTYNHWPEKNFIEKIHAAIQAVETPFVVMRADNRHAVPEAITQCATFLADNPDYSTCHGAYVAVERFGDFLSARPNYDEDNSRGLTGETPSARIIEVWNNYIPAFYAVCHTEHWKRVLNIAANGITNNNALEVLQSMVMAAEGKSKRLPIFYGAIQIANRISGKNKVYDGFDVVATNEHYIEEYTYFIKTIADRLAELECIDQDEAKKRVENSLAHFLKTCCVHHPRRTFIKKLPKYLKRALSVFDFNKHQRFLDERAKNMNIYLAPLTPPSKDNFSAMMTWLDSWKEEI